MLSPGTHVLWSHVIAPDHSEKSVLVLTEGLVGKDPDCRLGTIVAVANEEGTYFNVELDSGITRVLTNDELVEVEVPDGFVWPTPAVAVTDEA
jgi:hypothetical protein